MIKKIYNWSCIPAALIRMIFLALAALICNKKIEDAGGRFFYRKTKRLIYIRCWVALKTHTFKYYLPLNIFLLSPIIGAFGLATLSILTQQYWLLGYVLYALPMFMSVRDLRGIAWYIQSLNDKLDKQEDVEWKAAEQAFVDSIEDEEREKERQRIEAQRMLREKKFGRVIK